VHEERSPWSKDFHRPINGGVGENQRVTPTTFVRQTLRTKIRFYETFSCNEFFMQPTRKPLAARRLGGKAVLPCMREHRLQKRPVPSATFATEGLKPWNRTPGTPEIPARISILLARSRTLTWPQRVMLTCEARLCFRTSSSLQARGANLPKIPNARTSKNTHPKMHTGQKESNGRVGKLRPQPAQGICKRRSFIPRAATQGCT